MKINIVLPFISNRAVGGIKIMYQYADLLADKGHQITIYHTTALKNSPKKYLNPIKLIRDRIFKRDSIPSWFKFKNKLNFRLIPWISNNYIENGDIIVSTMYATAMDVFLLDIAKGKKYNFIQDFENWIAPETELIKSYKLPIKHIVINDYLYRIVEKFSLYKPILIYNAIDTNHFQINTVISNRNAYSICMMYSEEKRKGSIYGIEAIEICKNKFPDLNVTFFSVYPRRNNIPNWIHFIQSPKNLEEIYNNSAIFFTPSIGEGWALPPAEAMSCGCAVVCTDIGGHAAYAQDKITALLTKSKDSIDMAEKLTSLLSDTELRIKIAKNGNSRIKEFTWNNAITKLEVAFNE